MEDLKSLKAELTKPCQASSRMVIRIPADVKPFTISYRLVSMRERNTPKQGSRSIAEITFQSVAHESTVLISNCVRATASSGMIDFTTYDTTLQAETPPRSLPHIGSPDSDYGAAPIFKTRPHHVYAEHGAPRPAHRLGNSSISSYPPRTSRGCRRRHRKVGR